MVLVYKRTDEEDRDCLKQMDMPPVRHRILSSYEIKFLGPRTINVQTIAKDEIISTSMIAYSKGDGVEMVGEAVRWLKACISVARTDTTKKSLPYNRSINHIRG